MENLVHMEKLSKNLNEEKIQYYSELKKRIDYDLVLEGYKTYCYSNLGKEYLDSLNPYSTNAEQELRSVSEILDFIRLKGYPDKDAFIDVRGILQKVENGLIVETQEFIDILRFLEGIKSLKILFKEQKSTIFQAGIINLIQKLGSYDEIIDLIKKSIDENGSIRDNASVLLKKIRTEFNETTKELRHKAERFISHNQNILQELSYTIRNERYVLPIKSNERGKIKGIIHGTSSSGSTVYIEPEEFIPLNDKLRILAEEEAREISRILREITNKIFDRIKSLKEDIEILKKVDSIFARARYVIEKGASIIFPEGSYLKLSKARHPLISENRVVPIDIELPSDKTGIVITGPNTGGKTVSLKVIAISIVLARSGFPILVGESSRIPEFDVFVDIGDSQNILENLSTFSGHIVNIVRCLKLADKKSIVLIDELGSGTDPYEGSAIALGIIEELIEKEIKFVVTTHLTPVKLFSMSHDKLISASMEFDPETLSPTYRILMNIPGASHAFEIAAKYGLDNEIIQRAYRHLNEEHVKIEELIKNLNKHVSELEMQKRELESTLRDYNKQKKDLEDKYKLLKIKRIEELDKEIREVYKEIQKVKKDLQISLLSKKTESEELIKKRLKEIEEETKQVEEIQEKVEKVFYETKVPQEDRTIKIGDYVRLIDGTAIGKVIEVKQKGLVVDFNGFKIELRPEKLVKIQKGQLNEVKGIIETKVHGEKSTKEKIITSVTSVLTKNELDVRGLTVEEAIEKVDLFIDQLILSDFSFGYIIHGKGTGKLATGIWNYLRRDKRIKNYRFGRPNEGGVGVTVVEV